VGAFWDTVHRINWYGCCQWAGSIFSLKPCLHDTSRCQTGCQTGCTTGCKTGLTIGGWTFVYTMQPVVKPVWQPVVSCKQTDFYVVDKSQDPCSFPTTTRSSNYCSERMTRCQHTHTRHIHTSLRFPHFYMSCFMTVALERIARTCTAVCKSNGNVLCQARWQ